MLVHTGDEMSSGLCNFKNVILQMSPASKFPKVKKNIALLKKMCEYRDEEIPEKSARKKKKKFKQMKMV